MERKAVIDLNEYDKAMAILKERAGKEKYRMWIHHVIRLLEDEPCYVLEDDDY